MSTAVLRASGPKFDVDAFLERYPMIRPEKVWHRGEKSRQGKPTSQSGLNVLIGEADGSAEVVKRLDRFLSKAAGLINELSVSGASSEIDISLEVGSRKHFTHSIALETAQLKKLAELGVVLRISGYPVGDE